MAKSSGGTVVCDNINLSEAAKRELRLMGAKRFASNRLFPLGASDQQIKAFADRLKEQYPAGPPAQGSSPRF
ncbi:MAG: hypothetical protein A2365_03680 [Candidatus Nealsonbacteria bacterium RIFOXYB1_FULL_40_15]|uniref:Uncharacterized protein n=1 Tax=Candidatus Nealsonbacteria bacterium RIFOXYB1_FULL_40_15 TaxID=1801677 RepID=A0A1G2EPJ1_9BACT|nr:MAG: hypothetical protein A2365_03680 [Candidatus Nealsonbacteria bacterium RIFOXYB1_FULL_40_15]OGZ29526.1 MAG: hypothetical protein A2562_02450 [Candidatus Nealsonbacteria bacterium RIFOXYD1_FULL_39_11]